MKKLHRTLVIGCSLLALSACGPEDIASPGTGGNITINNGTGGGTPTPTPTPTGGTVTAATGCPTIADPQGLSDDGTITGPTGTWRVCTLPRTLKVSSTLTKVPGLLYRLNGRVDVGCDGGFAAPTSSAPYTSTTIGCTTPLEKDTNVTLTIDPGVILFGGTGVSWLAVNRGNKINAVGTATQPIIFTSRDNVNGLNSDASSGQWGGVVLMGRGVVTDCTSGTIPGTDCERQTEGATDPATFGGNDDTYNAGTMDYVQIRYSGYVLGSDKELQSLTPEAVGSGTKIDHFMTFNSSDDGIEFFGGQVNLKHYVAVGAEDDNLDIDTGARVNVQYALVVQRDGVGDTMMEIDSDGNESMTPRVRVNLSNFTFFQNKTGNSDGSSIYFRGNSDGVLMNGVVISPDNPCFGINNDYTTVEFHSVVMQCGTPAFKEAGATGHVPAAGTAQGFFTGGTNNDAAFVPTASSIPFFFTNTSGTPVYDANGSVSTFFDTVSYIGAFADATDTWYAGWTCNSSTADFGTGNSGACTSLPTT